MAKLRCANTPERVSSIGSRVRVVGALIASRGKVLLSKRRREQEHGGLWEFPGGKVEAGESDQEALARELAEELGIEATVGPRCCTVRHAYPDYAVDLVIYRCTMGDQQPTCRDVEEVAWFTYRQLCDIELTPPDLVVARRIMGERRA